jgi:predicted O-methyltransferase YrrM
MKALGLPDEYIAQHAMFSRDLPNVRHLEADSLDFDFAALGNQYDLVFIDGDHHYESVKRDTRNVFAHLLHEQSIVVWHDYAWQPGHLRYETLAAILAGIPENFRNRLYAVRNTLCAIYYPGTVRSSAPSAIARADEAYEVTIRVPAT